MGVRYFNELTNMAVLMEEVGELARIMARRYGEQSEKESDKDKDLGDEMAKQAKRSQEAWVDSLRAIREESNRAFNTDQAATMVQLAGNLRTTATIASANMNRIVVGGDD